MLGSMMAPVIADQEVFRTVGEAMLVRMIAPVVADGTAMTTAWYGRHLPEVMHVRADTDKPDVRFGRTETENTRAVMLAMHTKPAWTNTKYTASAPPLTAAAAAIINTANSSSSSGGNKSTEVVLWKYPIQRDYESGKVARPVDVWAGMFP